MQDKRFGRWLVIGDCIMTDRSERKWLCRCDCGTERYVLQRALTSGRSISCGCTRKEKATQSSAKDITGQRFGELTVLTRSEAEHKNGGIWWKCRCSCGELYECPATLLVTGKKTHCSSTVHRKPKDYIDISGRRFQWLIAVSPTEKRDAKGSVVWRCRCDCGQEIEASYNNLLYTNLVSCGCRKKDHSSKLSSYLTRVADTSLESLKSKKVPVNNTTGYRGVYLIRGKYVAKINFQKKSYYLGAYNSITDAIRARQIAEEQLFDTVTAFYARWKLHADRNPQWAKENPVRITVAKQDNAEFDLILQPVFDVDK